MVANPWLAWAYNAAVSSGVQGVVDRPPSLANDIVA